jgi:hypothetical protein
VATYKNKLGDREEILKRLGVDLYNPRNWAPPSADEMRPKDGRKYHRFFERIRNRFQTDGGKSKKRTVRVKQGFELSDVFAEWSDPEYEGFESILFRDLKGASDVFELLSRWKINYGGKCCYWCIDGRVVHAVAHSLFPPQRTRLSRLHPGSIEKNSQQ